MILDSIRPDIAQTDVFNYFNLLIFHHILLRVLLMGAQSKSENYCQRPHY